MKIEKDMLRDDEYAFGLMGEWGICKEKDVGEGGKRNPRTSWWPGVSLDGA